jgi:hypothetical protein
MRLQSVFGRLQLTQYEPVQTGWTGPWQPEGTGLCRSLSVQSGFGKRMKIRNRFQSQSFQKREKNRTGPDFQTLEEKQEEQLQDLAEAIPSITRPKSRTESFPTFASIMATQTQTHTLAASGERDRNYFI